MRLAQRFNGFAWLAALAGIWLWIWFYLSADWRANEQYQYGFAVPFLFLYLFLERWRGGSGEQKATWKSATLLAAGWMVFLFAELLRQQDPIWRLTGASMMVAATGVTAVWLYRCGGPALVRAEAFPLAFAWLALPWPVPVELYLTQNLLAILSAGTVILLNWAGVAALQHGNAIELTNGMVGIDTACSGIQSLQSSLMAALFLGEFYRIHWGRRVWLLGLAWMTAMGANFIRVLFLTCMAHLHGVPAVAIYHDKAGYAASLATFALILLLASRLGGGTDPRPESEGERPLIPLSGKDGVALLLGLFCIPVAAWAWFASVSHKSLEIITTPRWTLHTGALPDGWRVVESKVSPHEYSMLRYSKREAFSLMNAAGDTVQFVHFFWEPGKSMPAAGFYHTPEMCMPWVGWKEISAPRPVTLTVSGTALPCVEYRFRMDETRRVVYQTLCTGGRISAFILDPAAMAGRGKRLSMLWRAPREQVNEELLVFLPELEASGTESQAALAGEFLGKVLRSSRPAP